MLGVFILRNIKVGSYIRSNKLERGMYIMTQNLYTSLYFGSAIVKGCKWKLQRKITCVYTREGFLSADLRPRTLFDVGAMLFPRALLDWSTFEKSIRIYLPFVYLIKLCYLIKLVLYFIHLYFSIKYILISLQFYLWITNKPFSLISIDIVSRLMRCNDRSKTVYWY